MSEIHSLQGKYAFGRGNKVSNKIVHHKKVLNWKLKPKMKYSFPLIFSASTPPALTKHYNTHSLQMFGDLHLEWINLEVMDGAAGAVKIWIGEKGIKKTLNSHRWCKVECCEWENCFEKTSKVPNHSYSVVTWSQFLWKHSILYIVTYKSFVGKIVPRTPFELHIIKFGAWKCFFGYINHSVPNT